VDAEVADLLREAEEAKPREAVVEKPREAAVVKPREAAVAKPREAEVERKAARERRDARERRVAKERRERRARARRERNPPSLAPNPPADSPFHGRSERPSRAPARTVSSSMSLRTPQLKEVEAEAERDSR
jgi:hypothetical protein